MNVPTRVVKDLAQTISATFTDGDGVAVDPAPDTCTVQVLRDDGTELVPAGTATVNAGTGKFTYALTPANTAQYDRLRARWTSALGTIETIVEIGGPPLFTVAELQAQLPDSNPSSDTCVEARVLAEQAFEDAAGVAFVPRYHRETLSGPGGTRLLLGRHRPLQVIACAVDDVALTVDELAELKIDDGGELYRPTGWPRGVRNIEISYAHGWPAAPLRVARAVRLLAKQHLVSGPIDDRSIRRDDENGSFLLLAPGLRGSTFGIPDVDQALSDYGIPSVAQ